jgi:N-acetylneuraminic acid mutarotase
LTSDGYAFSIGTTLYHSGGYFQNYSTSAYVLSLDTSNPSAAWQFSSQLLVSRGDHSVTVVNDVPIAAGGFNDAVGFCTPLTSVEAYNATTNTWFNRSSLAIGRGDSAEGIAITSNGASRLYVIGGETLDASCTKPIPIAQVESYDPITDTWRLEESIPDSRMRFGGDGYNMTVFIFGGQHEYQGPGTDVFKVYNTTYALYVGGQDTATPTSTSSGTTSAPITGPTRSGAASVSIVGVATLLAAVVLL